MLLFAVGLVVAVGEKVLLLTKCGGNVPKCLLETLVNFVLTPVVMRHSQQTGQDDLAAGKILERLVHTSRRRVHVIAEHAVRARYVIILFFIHFFVENNFLADDEALARTLPVNIAGHAYRLHAGFQAAICATRGRDVRSFLVLFVRAHHLHRKVSIGTRKPMVGSVITHPTLHLDVDGGLGGTGPSTCCFLGHSR